MKRDITNVFNYRRQQFNDFGVDTITADPKNPKLHIRPISSFEALEDNTYVEYWENGTKRVKQTYQKGDIITTFITEFIVLAGLIRVAYTEPVRKSAWFTFRIQGDTTPQITQSGTQTLETYLYDLDGNQVDRQLINANNLTITTPNQNDDFIVKMLPLDRNNLIHPRFNNRPIKEILHWGIIKWIDFEQTFRGDYDLDISAEDVPDFSVLGFGTAEKKFTNAFSSTSPTPRNISIKNLNAWDVSEIESLAQCFLGCNFGWKDGLNMSDWDVSNVTNMYFTFGFSVNTKGLDISKWNTSSLERLISTFRASDFNGYINDWDVSNVTEFTSCFSDNQSYNQPLTKWDVSSGESFNYMFWKTNFTSNLNSWDVSSGTDFNNMFEGSAFNKPLSEWDVSSATNMEAMFKDNINFNQNLSSWDVSNVTNSTDFDSNTIQWIRPKPNF